MNKGKTPHTAAVKDQANEVENHYLLLHHWRRMQKMMKTRFRTEVYAQSQVPSLQKKEAFDPLDPTGNITIKWDVMAWTSDGYVAVVTIYNFEIYRHIEPPGWSLQWAWAEKEVIWNMVGAQTTEQGDCSSFKGNIPHSCKKNPTVVDLLPGTPYNQQIANCCKGGVISSSVSDPENSVSSFQLSVGAAGTTNRTVKLPKNFTLKAPGPGYTCGAVQIVQPTKFVTSDGRRVTQAMMTWRVVCTYSQFLVRNSPACCVSLSSYYNNTIVPCPTCSCGCQNKNNTSGSCVDRKTGLGKNNSTIAPIVQCSSHMCPSQVHWHVMVNEKKYWQVKITVTNLNYKINNTHWNLVIQHPNIDKLVVRVFSFNYKTFISTANDTVLMMWGVKKKKNDLIIGASSFDGGKNHVQSEVLFRKENSGLALEKGWVFPVRVLFNGDNCVMPPPDAYPYLPNTAI